MILQLVRKQDQAKIVTQGKIANNFLTRLQGLIGKKIFQEGDALLFPHCNSVHMWMMSVPIDIVFLKVASPKNQAWEVLKIVQNVKPWKLLPVNCFAANDTLELPSGTISKFNLKPGEVLCIA